MADTSTLLSIPHQPTRERQRNVVGGTWENIEDIFDTITGVGQGYTNEVPVSAKDLDGLINPSEFKTKFPRSGEITDFQKAKTAEKSDEELIREKRKAVAIGEEIVSEHAKEQMQITLTQKRIEVNSAIGIGNVLYENTVNDDGSLRIDVQVEMDRKNSEMNAAELKANREKQVTQAIGKAPVGFQMRQGELDMGKERIGGGHFTTAPG